VTERSPNPNRQMPSAPQTSRQKGRPENQVADQEEIESAKYQADVHALKSLKGECHEVEGRREQREALVHQLKDVIEE
jgi:hypothetical protein